MHKLNRRRKTWRPRLNNNLLCQNSKFKIQNSKRQGQSGQVLIFTLGLTAAILIATIFVLTLTQHSAEFVQQATKQVQAHQLAEAGLDRALEQLARDSTWTGENDTNLGPGTLTIAVSETDPPDPAKKRVVATGAVPRRQAGASQITLAIEVHGSGPGGQIGFNFAVQADTGGITMHHGSKIQGNVWSNGPVTGDSSAENQVITGTVTVAGPTGLIDRVKGTGSLTAHQITRAVTNANASADILTNTNFQSGTGYWEDQQSGNHGTLVHQTFTPPTAQTLPITDAHLDQLRATTNQAPTFNGDYAVPAGSPQTLGPLVISGNLDLAGSAHLTLMGNVRVLGNITLGNGAIIDGDPAAFGGSDETAVLLAEGDITANQSASFSGTVVILAIATTGNFTLHQSVQGKDILFAASPHGTTDVDQGDTVRQISAQTIILRNAAEIPSFPSTVQITYGGTGGGTWVYTPGTWQELPVN